MPYSKKSNHGKVLVSSLGEVFRAQTFAVAVIDDVPASRQAIKRSLHAVGARNVELFSSAEEMIVVWRSKHFDIIISDLHMEGRSGSWLLESGRQEGYLRPNDIFMIISGETDANAIGGLLTLGPDEFLVKPYNERSFYKRLLSNLKRVIVNKEIIKRLSEGERYDSILRSQLSMVDPTEMSQARCYKALGAALLQIRNFGGAIKHYKEAERIFSIHHQEWIQLGAAAAFQASGAYLEAVKTYQSLLKKNQNCSKIHVRMSECFESLGELRSALNSAYEVYRKAPRDVIAAERVLGLAKELNDFQVIEEVSYRIVRLEKRKSGEIGKRLCDHLLACGELMQGNAAMRAEDEELVRRFQSSLNEMRRQKDISPAELSNSFKAEIQYYLSEHRIDAAMKTRERWNTNIQSGKAKPLSEAQELTLNKMFTELGKTVAA